jgi:hypothetical protein
VAATKKKLTKGAKPKAKAKPTGGLDRGRPTDYLPQYAKIAEEMCRLGATDKELAAAFGVDTTTIWRWQSKHEEFCNALVVGKDPADNRVERSLYQRAIGYSFDTEKLFNDKGSIIRAKTTEHVPPDPQAGWRWLFNRRPKVWRDTSRIELTGQDGEPLIDTRELARALIERTRMQLEHLPEPVKLKPFIKKEGGE